MDGRDSVLQRLVQTNCYSDPSHRARFGGVSQCLHRLKVVYF